MDHETETDRGLTSEARKIAVIFLNKVKDFIFASNKEFLRNVKCVGEHILLGSSFEFDYLLGENRGATCLIDNGDGSELDGAVPCPVAARHLAERFDGFSSF
jgi:hypothetical protein